MPRSGPIAAALNKAIRSAPRAAPDAAAVALAKRYAALLDDGAPAGKYFKALNVLRSVTRNGDDETRAAFDTVARALSSHSVASDLGPKLKDLLVALELAPSGRRAARGEESGGVPIPTGVVPGADELAQLRANRAGRQQHP